MMELTEEFLAKAAGWEAVKQARELLAADKVLSSDWQPPILRGMVQEGSISYRAGLVVKDAIDLENLCTCRASQRWGTICAHSVAVGLHFLKAGGGSQETKARSQETVHRGLAEKGSGQRIGPGVGEAEGNRQSAVANRSSPLAPRPSPPARRQLKRVAVGEAGEPLEVFIILPPNFGTAIDRGKVMVCLEGHWRGGRGPLNQLPLDIDFALTAADAALLDHLEGLAEGDTPGLLQLRTDQLIEWLPLLVDHSGVTLGKSLAVTVTAAPWKVALKVNLEDSGELRLSLKPAGPLTALFGQERAWVFHDQILQPLGLPKPYWDVLRSPLRLARSRVPQCVGQDWAALQGACEIDANFDIDDFTFEPQAPRFMLSLDGGLAQLQAELKCVYGARILPLGTAGSAETFWLPDPGCPTRYSTRNRAAEQAALARLVRAGFTGPDMQGRWQLQGQDSVLNFFARDYPRLRSEWEVRLEERLERSTRQNLEPIVPRFQITPSGQHWFDLEVSFQTPSGERFNAADIQRLVLSGQGHTRLRNGRMALLDTGAVAELQEVLRDGAPEQHAGKYRLHNAQAGFLGATLEQQAGWQVQASPSWRTWAQQQSGEAPPPCPPLGELETVLRPYQKAGVAWLHFLRVNGFGGILADEMGLGKTLQTLAFLQTVTLGFPALVVCPTSLVFNWVAEAKRFTPNLKVLALTGSQRQALFAQIPQHQMVVTSYALLRRDAERYREWEFDTVVLDEAQHIKNRQTQNAQAVKAVRARHRFVLTGTPLENSVADLWSIFDFLMPGYLGAAQDFRERYEWPIMRDRDGAVQARLTRRVRPFLLRRVKREVAPDLPPRIEQVALCELTEDQAAVYRQVLQESRRALTETAGAQDSPQNRLLILTALLRLRQVCCDLRLLKLPNLDPASASGKLDLLGELLEEVWDGGHRVLIFSQFVGMLALLREKLTADGVDFCYLDGSTLDREAVVKRFQTQEQIPVFLISLKAGGVGLNLTGADTVIHYDPWWNPAVADQASDRAHRFGQKRVVTTYKLITRGTVEEKILNLQARKRGVLKATLGGEEPWAEGLTWEEIQGLLADH